MAVCLGEDVILSGTASQSSACKPLLNQNGINVHWCKVTGNLADSTGHLVFFSLHRDISDVSVVPIATE